MKTPKMTATLKTELKKAIAGWWKLEYAGHGQRPEKFAKADNVWTGIQFLDFLEGDLYDDVRPLDAVTRWRRSDDGHPSETETGEWRYSAEATKFIAELGKMARKYIRSKAARRVCAEFKPLRRFQPNRSRRLAHR